MDENNNVSDGLKKEYLKVELEVERLRTDFSAAFAKESDIISKL